MKKQHIIFSSLFSLLIIGCGQMSDNTSPGNNIDTNTVKKQDSTLDPSQIADHLDRSGISKDRAIYLKESLEILRDAAKASGVQYNQDSKDNVEKMIEGLSLVKGNTTPSKHIKPFAYRRALLIQATENIAKNSLQNFEYHQRVDSYSGYLDYRDNGCSSPFNGEADIFFYRACDQHDFGYRNGYAWKETHNANFKGAVDAVFGGNMRETCESNWKDRWFDKGVCFTQAATYLYAVSNASTTTAWLSITSNRRDGEYPSKYK